jgi:hypothetical protein
MIHPHPCTVLDLLSQPYNYVIPRYQRGYDWQKEEISELIDDLLESQSSLYLGTMIFDAADRARTNAVAVVDGQQRLTTILLMLIACRQIAEALGQHQIAAQTQGRIAFIDPATGETRGPRLHSSASIRDLFDYVASQPWNGTFPTKLEKKQIKLQVRYLKPAYDYIAKSLGIKTKEDLSRTLKAIYQITVIRIDVDEEEEAFSIFERTNARGVDLEVEDLLKNYLYQKAVPDLDEQWSGLVGNADGTVLRMLKYFYMARNGPVAKSELYKKLKLYAVTLQDSKILVEQLVEFSTFYALVRREGNAKAVSEYFNAIGLESIGNDQDSYDRVFHTFQALRLFKVTQAIPILHAAVLCALRTEEAGNRKALLNLIQNVERYHFLNNAIGERPTNEIERIYGRYCSEFKISSSISKTASELMKDLQSTLVEKQEFVRRFVQISYAPSTLGLIAYIFDRQCNIGRAPGQRVSVFDPDPKVKRRSYNLEHFAPQTPKAPAKALDLNDNIGNLLAICFRVNASLGQDTPERKIERLEAELASKIENQANVKDFIKFAKPKAKNWSDKDIIDRAKSMAEDAYDRIWRFPTQST